ncbi:MAG: radical SAM protein [Nitrospinae bacterium]|nr:radical SAM protein [Nitrospinota bacterium]
MFRLTGLLKAAYGADTADSAPPGNGKHRAAPAGGPVVIWNLTRRCNLVCAHCYAWATDATYRTELSGPDALRVVDDLKEAGCRQLIFSGGEPLLRSDIFDLAARAKKAGMLISLSTNGTVITDAIAGRIRDTGFDYVGVSLDGVGATHDRFRGKEGAFEESLAGLLRCKRRGLKTGLRFTITTENLPELPFLFRLAEEQGFHKIYISHLVSSGRGRLNMALDPDLTAMRGVMDYIFEKGREYVENGNPVEIVTGNNEADAAYFLLKIRESRPERFAKLLSRLRRWGGNSSGIGIANIDARGNVHPDPLLSSITLGNVLEKPFGEIWRESGDPALERLRERPRQIGGRCGSCVWLDVCNGGSRARAAGAGNIWGADPGCYLTEEEIHAAEMVAS